MRVAPDKTLLYVSPASESILGYPPAALLGPAPVGLIHPEDLESVGQAWTALWAQPGPQKLTCRCKTKEGCYRWLETAGRAVRDERTGAITEIVVTARDVMLQVHHFTPNSFQSRSGCDRRKIASVDQAAMSVATEAHYPMEAHESRASSPAPSLVHQGCKWQAAGAAPSRCSW